MAIDNYEVMKAIQSLEKTMQETLKIILSNLEKIEKSNRLIADSLYRDRLASLEMTQVIKNIGLGD